MASERGWKTHLVKKHKVAYGSAWVAGARCPYGCDRTYGSWAPWVRHHRIDHRGKDRTPCPLCVEEGRESVFSWDGTRQDGPKKHGLNYHGLSHEDAEALAERIMEARKGKENVAPAAAAEPSAGPSRTRTSPDEDADDDSEWEEAPKRKKRKLRR